MSHERHAVDWYGARHGTFTEDHSLVHRLANASDPLTGNKNANNG